MKSLLSVAALVVGLAYCATASAEPAPDAGKRKYPNMFKEGLPYSGVTLKGGEPPKPKTPPPAGLHYITWPGFRPDPQGGAEVFVQLTGPAEYKVKQRGRRIFVTVKKVKIYLKNNLRWVVTKHFPGPVARFRLRRRGRTNARLEIALRKKATPSVQLKSQGPYSYLIVRFPAGS